MVAAFGDERRAVCRPLLAWLLMSEEEAGRRGGEEGGPSGCGWGCCCFTDLEVEDTGSWVLQPWQRMGSGKGLRQIPGDEIWANWGGAVKRALGLESCTVGTDSWFNPLNSETLGQKLYLSEPLTKELPEN